MNQHTLDVPTAAPRSPLLLAARRPLHLAVLAVALLTGLTVWIWLLPLGLVAYALATFLASRDPAMERAARRASLEAGATGPALSGPVVWIERVALDVEREADRAPEALAPLFERIREQTGALVEAARDVSRKRAAIDEYLVRADLRSIRSELARLDERLGRVTDPETRRHTQRTRQALAAREQATVSLATYRDRADAQLGSIGATLDNVLAEVVRLRASDEADVGSAAEGVAGRLDDLNADVAGFRAALDDALVVGEGQV